MQLLRLLLLQLPRPELLLVQNPPSIPTLAVAWLAARLRGAALVIDWHNLGFSILSHSRGSDRHPLVKVRGGRGEAVGEKGRQERAALRASVGRSIGRSIRWSVGRLID